ncbi:cysteine-rich CWC family protein [Catalinimonas alkaloidigena]|uniref:cysteine-rich CWC family protein n=1 Tax=Catalinimonas alkaloidigena TaxID=1075417 RepID=UPI003B8A8666
MSLHETKYCHRCMEAFECKPGNIGECQCFGLRLTDSAKEYIFEHYSACLCRNCLEEIGQKLEAEK